MTARTDAERAAEYGRLLAEIAEFIHCGDLPLLRRVVIVSDLLNGAGIHGGQTDPHGQPAPVPHEQTCHLCHPLLAALEDAGGVR